VLSSIACITFIILTIPTISIISISIYYLTLSIFSKHRLSCSIGSNFQLISNHSITIELTITIILTTIIGSDYTWISITIEYSS